MGWHKEETWKVHIDGDEGSVYLPEEAFKYLNDLGFSLLVIERDNPDSHTVYSFKHDQPAMKSVYDPNARIAAHIKL